MYSIVYRIWSLITFDFVAEDSTYSTAGITSTMKIRISFAKMIQGRTISN